MSPVSGAQPGPAGYTAMTVRSPHRATTPRLPPPAPSRASYNASPSGRVPPRAIRTPLPRTDARHAQPQPATLAQAMSSRRHRPPSTRDRGPRSPTRCWLKLTPLRRGMVRVGIVLARRAASSPSRAGGHRVLPGRASHHLTLRVAVVRHGVRGDRIDEGHAARPAPIVAPPEARCPRQHAQISCASLQEIVRLREARAERDDRGMPALQRPSPRPRPRERGAAARVLR